MNDDTDHASDPYGRQLNEYFSAWARALQQAIAPGQGAQGPGVFSAPGMESLGAAAGGPWLQAIHQLARQALEQELDSAGIANAWRQILQQGLWPDALPLTDLFAGNAWASNPGADSWLDHPAFGPLREHMQRWQQLGRQQRQAQAEFSHWQSLLGQVRELALAQFEQLLRGHEQAPLTNARALLDLWVEAAEHAWQQVAMSEDFARAAAQFSQAQMQLLQTQQGEADRLFASLGIASRRELDQAYLRIDTLERQVRQLLAMQAAAGPAKPARQKPQAADSKPAGSAAAKPASRPGAAKTARAPRAGRSKG